MAAVLPRIAVIGTGGTISSLGASSLDVLDYPDFGQKLSAEALLDRFPETRLVADPVPITVRQVGSTEIGPAEWLELRALIHKIARDEPATAGFVITHGTATLEETAFFLNLTLAVNQPVVLVGAQRPASALGTDAGMNLVNALRVAGASEACGKGVLVLLNDEINSARDVVKTSTYRVQTFRSFDFGALGHVDGDGVHFYRAPLGRHMPEGPFATADLVAPLLRVDIIYSYAGADGALIDAAVVAGGARVGVGRVCPGQSDPGSARRLRARPQGRCRCRAMQPRRERPCRPAPPVARNRHRCGRGFEPAKGPHPADVGAGHDNRHHGDPAAVPTGLSAGGDAGPAHVGGPLLDYIKIS